MGMGFAPTWLRQLSPLLHMTTLTTELWLTKSYFYLFAHYGRTLSERPCYILALFFFIFFYGRLSWRNG